MKKGVLSICTIFLLHIYSVCASASVSSVRLSPSPLSVRSDAIVYILLFVNTIGLIVLGTLFLVAYRRYFPELLKTTKEEIKEERVAHKHHYDEHVVEQLHRYIVYYQEHGYTHDHLRKALQDQGYQTNDIEEAVARTLM